MTLTQSLIAPLPSLPLICKSKPAYINPGSNSCQNFLIFAQKIEKRIDKDERT
jgi:hypothetical protein